MLNELKELESKKKFLYNKLSKLGNFRRGTISVNYRKCGKKDCVCAKKRHPGHGPQYLWNATIKGKSYAKNLKLGPWLQKYMEEIDNYKKFKTLCDDIIKVNEKVCKLCPPAVIEDMNEEELLKKKLQILFMRKYKKK